MKDGISQEDLSLDDDEVNAISQEADKTEEIQIWDRQPSQVDRDLLK